MALGILEVSREVTEDGSLVADDGLHPSGQQYRRRLDVIVPAFEAALRD